MRLLGALGVLVLCAGTALGADTIKLKGGERVRGEATAYDEARRVLSFRTTDGEVRRFHMDELDGRSVYQAVRSKVPKSDGEKQLRLANYARDIGLYAHAARHYGYARDADPALAPKIEVEVAKLKSEAARWAMDNAREEAAKGNTAEAEKWLTRLIDKLPDEPLAQEARALLSDHYDEVRADKQARFEAEQAGKLEKDLQPAKRNYDRMLEANKKALLGKRSSSQVVRDWNSAVRYGERALRDLEQVRKSYPDPGTQERLSGYRKIVTDEIIDVHMNLASHYSTQSSYQQAADETNKALALDPRNERALGMRARVEENASRSGGWGWGRW